MATNLNQQSVEIKDLSGGVQTATTQFLKKPNQVEFSVNADFSKIGGVQKIKGYDRLGNTITTSSTTSSTTTTTTTSTSTSTSSSTSSSSSSSSTTTP